MYDLITVHAGHSEEAPGAFYEDYKEHVIARQIKDKLIQALKAVGQNCVDTTSDVGTKLLVLQEVVSKCNSYVKPGKTQLDVSLHLNALGGASTATGTEVLYFNQKGLSEYVAKEISNAAGWRNRGSVERKGLYVLRHTQSPAILIEVCFIDNPSDMKILFEKMDLIVEAICFALTGKRPEKVSSDVYHRVIVGSFEKLDHAKERQKELDEAGFDSFIDIYEK